MYIRVLGGEPLIMASNNYGGIYGYDTGENSLTATARIKTKILPQQPLGHEIGF
jgi:hypothetical protein